jgi:hypothetical protein
MGKREASHHTAALVEGLDGLNMGVRGCAWQGKGNINCKTCEYTIVPPRIFYIKIANSDFYFIKIFHKI